MPRAVGAPAIAGLRLDLTTHGLRIAQTLLDAGFGLGLAADEAQGGFADGIDLILPGGYWTNVSILPSFTRHSPWQLEPAAPGQEALVIRHRAHGAIPVTLPDTTRFRHQRCASGVPCGEVGAVHGRWVVIAPFAPRPPLELARPRRFLGLPPSRPLSKGQWSVDEVVACAEAAWRFARVRLVHLEASHVLRPDGGVAELAPYLAALTRALPTLISVAVAPPEDPAAVLALYAAGADAVSYHLLAWDAQAAGGVAPLRHRFVPQERIHAALDAAARYFPRGAVSTDLLLGLEPLAAVEDACRQLCARAVVPNIALFRALPGAEDHAPSGEALPQEGVLALMATRAELLRRHHLAASRVRGFPRVLSGMDRYHPSALDRTYASWRRRLRVRTVTAA